MKIKSPPAIRRYGLDPSDHQYMIHLVSTADSLRDSACTNGTGDRGQLGITIDNIPLGCQINFATDGRYRFPQAVSAFITILIVIGSSEYGF